jgi:hypothetical protein
LTEKKGEIVPHSPAYQDSIVLVLKVPALSGNGRLTARLLI